VSKDKNRVRLSVDVDKDTHRKLRILAAIEDTNIAELVRKLIQQELAANPKSNAS
jgi:hypothetical protein